jgi:hypothetical membrane protein
MFMNLQRIPAICGLLAPVWFLVALVAFAAARSDYSHLTKAVSELGAVGAPHALAWNIVGFGAIGGLIVVLAIGVWQQANARWAAVFIALSGIAFAAAGVFPADMSNFEADTTRLHILASLVSLAAFVIAVPFMGGRLWRSGRRGFAVAAIAFGLAVVLTLLLRETEMPPGLAQRINFVGYLAWMALVASSLITQREATQ